MKFDMTKVLHDHRGNPIIDPMKLFESDTGEQPLTLGAAIEKPCIIVNRQSDSADRKYQQAQIAARASQPEAEFSRNDISLIREVCALVLSPVAIGAIFDALASSETH